MEGRNTAQPTPPHFLASVERARSFCTNARRASTRSRAFS
jgi:hypothetical protein